MGVVSVSENISLTLWRRSLDYSNTYVITKSNSSRNVKIILSELS